PPGRLLIYRGTQKLLRKRLPDDMPAPWEALQAVRTGLSQGLVAGLQYEREAIGRVASTPACRNLVNMFFLRDKARKLPEDLEAGRVPRIRRVGIVGAGIMGAGIAQLAALRGCEVVIQEVNEAALAAGIQRIEELFQKAVERRLISAADAPRRLAAI